MPSQRARDAESRVRNKSSNGPLRVQSNVWYSVAVCQANSDRIPAEYPATCWHTSVAGDMLVSC